MLLRADGAWERTRARWVVGSDGANSTIRRMHALPFDGTTYEERFVLADVQLDWELPHEDVTVIYGDGNMAMTLPLPGAQRRARIVMNDDEGDGELSLGYFRDLFASRVPIRANLSDAGWVSRFRMHKRMVPRYRVGRTFLAGDAAHIHSPISGQGMNLGVQDAYNLAWKLALVERGRAKEELLDTYDEERRPLAAAVLNDTDRETRLAMLEGWLATRVRSQLVSTALRFPALHKRLLDAAAELSWNYRQSRLSAEARSSLYSANVIEDRRTENATVRDWREFSAAPHAGDRVPDVRTEQGQRLFDVLRGPAHSLLLFDGRAPTAEGYATLARIADDVRARFGDSVATKIVINGRAAPGSLAARQDLLLDDGGRLHARLGAGAECLYLIRPDGYVGFRSQPADGGALIRHLGGYLA